MKFLQKILVDQVKIRQAPIVRLQSKINIECQEGRIQPLVCCVQSAYRVKWFQDSVLASGKYGVTLKTPQSDHAEKLDKAIKSLSDSQHW